MTIKRFPEGIVDGVIAKLRAEMPAELIRVVAGNYDSPSFIGAIAYAGTGNGILSTILSTDGSTDTETVTILCTSATGAVSNWSVTGSKTGAIGTFTLSGASYSFVSTRIKFTLTAGIIDFVQTDKFIVATNKATNSVQLPTIENRNYYISEKYEPFVTPACFVLAGEGINYPKDLTKTNYVHGTIPMNVNIVCENRKEDLLTRMAWRYMGAAHTILDQAAILTSDNILRCVIKITGTTFSPLFTNGTEFRKEIMIKCTVEFWQNF